LAPLLRPSPWLLAARKPPLLLRPLLRPLRLPRLRPPRLLTLLPRLPLRLPKLLRLPPRLPLAKPRSNFGNEIVSVKPAQAGDGLPGFSIWVVLFFQ
jgi:hypothetical protein